MTKSENPRGQRGLSSSSGRPGHSDSNPIPAFVFDPEDRALHNAEAEVRAAGYALAVQCLDCKSWLVNAKSVAAHRGPRCRARRNGGAA